PGGLLCHRIETHRQLRGQHRAVRRWNTMEETFAHGVELEHGSRHVLLHDRAVNAAGSKTRQGRPRAHFTLDAHDIVGIGRVVGAADRNYLPVFPQARGGGLEHGAVGLDLSRREHPLTGDAEELAHALKPLRTKASAIRMSSGRSTSTVFATRSPYTR